MSGALSLLACHRWVACGVTTLLSCFEGIVRQVRGRAGTPCEIIGPTGDDQRFQDLWGFR